MHKFLGQLIDAEHKTTGHTVLYIPDEGPKMSEEESYKDKEFVQRMESKKEMLYFIIKIKILVIVIHWTRQIKELLNSQESLESADTSGPLQEIAFWRARCEDLSGIV